MTKKIARVTAHWFNDSGDVEIVELEPIEAGRTFRNNLFWFSGNNRPLWEPGTELTEEEIVSFKCYKQKRFQSMNDIPDDCYMPLLNRGGTT